MEPKQGKAKRASRLVIAVDGPVGAGKSTAARRLAMALDLVYIDSGAMYRAMGWKAVQAGVDLRDHAALCRLAAETDIRVVPGGSGRSPRLLVDGVDVTASLRTPPMDEASSLVSTCAGVRERLVALQRGMAREHGVAMDGRDIGTVVFPDADVKFFLDADLDVRAGRRAQDLAAAGAPAELGRVRAEVLRRDARDTSRDISPLRAAPDAIRLDTTGLDADRVLEAMLSEVAKVVDLDNSL
jgi:cytidylate kinase